jgi:hypothetical protein
MLLNKQKLNLYFCLFKSNKSHMYSQIFTNYYLRQIVKCFEYVHALLQFPNRISIYLFYRLFNFQI